MISWISFLLDWKQKEKLLVSLRKNSDIILYRSIKTDKNSGVRKIARPEFYTNIGQIPSFSSVNCHKQ